MTVVDRSDKIGSRAILMNVDILKLDLRLFQQPFDRTEGRAGWVTVNNYDLWH
jgi:hypothetical protein